MFTGPHIKQTAVEKQRPKQLLVQVEVPQTLEYAFYITYNDIYWQRVRPQGLSK